jgi:MYXO-CTERM domain-containing protein
VAVYCSDTQGGNWQIVGGTSAAAPIVAGAFTALNAQASPSFIWQNPTDFFDITTGSNSPGGCATPVLCTAGVGWDGPTGWGSPNGTALGGGMQATSDAGAPDDGGANASSAGDSGAAASSGGGDGAILDGPGNAVGSSSGGAGLGPSSGGASSGKADASIVLEEEAGVGLADASLNDNASSWNPYAPAGCGCTVVDGESRYGAMAALGGILAAWARRRKRHSA